MEQHDHLLRLIDLAYQAAVDPGHWPAFLQYARTAFRSADASLLSHNLIDRRPGVSVSTLAPDVQRAYLQRWGQEDPWARSPLTRTLGAGNVAVGEQLISRSDLERTAFHGDFGRHVDVERVIVLMIEDAPQVLSAFSISRSARRGEFGSSDATMLRALAPHVRRALQIHRRLIGAEGFGGGLVAALDRLTHGVVLVGESGAVLFANRAAEATLSTNDGLTLRHGQLHASRAAQTNTLLACIASAAGTSLGAGTGSGGIVVLERQSGKAPLRVLVTPMRPRHVVLGAQQPAAVLFITDPERSAVPAAVHLQRVFGLSAAETRVATTLLDGETVDGLADRLCISRSTARTHLRRLFAKTNTTRQADLIRVLLGAHAPLRFD